MSRHGVVNSNCNCSFLLSCRQQPLFERTMRDRTDVEEAHDIDDTQEEETESLLPTSRPQIKSTSPTQSKSCKQYTFGLLHISVAFVFGVLACLAAQAVILGPNCFTYKSKGSDIGDPKQEAVSALGSPYAGSTSVDNFPPTKPTNAFPSLFPSDVGYPGGTPTGAEAAVIATAPAYPSHTGQCSHQLLVPKLLEGQAKGQVTMTDESVGFKKKPKFNLFRSWGNLTPWFSVGRNRFGVNSTPAPPKTCRITGLHFLHRHGARYPTAWSMLSSA